MESSAYHFKYQIDFQEVLNSLKDESQLNGLTIEDGVEI